MGSCVGVLVLMWFVSSSVGSSSICKLPRSSSIVVDATVLVFVGALRVFAPGFVRLGSVLVALHLFASSCGSSIKIGCCKLGFS